MLNTLWVWTKICLAAVAITACGGCGGDQKTSTALMDDISGRWKISEISTDNNCDEGIDTPYTLKFTQSGNDLAVFHPDLSQTFSGKVVGTSIEWSGSYPEDGGTMDLDHVKASVTDGSISGTSSWRWSDGFNSCSGTTQFTGTRQ